MILNYIKIAWRNLIKNKIYSLINIGGLALGIATFLLILQYVGLEKSVNQFHAKKDNLYRLLCQNTEGNSWPYVEPGWADKIKARFPEVKEYCRFEQGSGQGIVQNPLKNISFREQKIGYVEGNFFEFFSFPLIQGTPDALKKPDVMLVSQAAAKKYFGDAPPLGEKLKLYNQFGERTYTIGGVFKDIGDESDIRYDMVFSLETLKNKTNLNGNGWADLDNIDNQYINMYFELAPGADYLSLEKKITMLRRESQKEIDAIQFRLQPMTDIHLASSASDDLQHTGNKKYIYMLLGISILILIIAWFNYINLSTAYTLKRAGEVGVRKVIGASRSNLVQLFMIESAMVNVVAFAGGIILAGFLQPFFNDLMGKNLSFSSLFLNYTWLLGLVLIFTGSMASGIYNSLSLSGFNPIQTLKGKIAKSSGGVLLRKTLVISQFAISVTLIIATIIVFRQLRFMKNQTLGVNLDQLVVITAPDITDSTFGQKKAAYLNEIASQNFVVDYCTSGSFPGRGYNFSTEGFSSPKSKPGVENKPFGFVLIDEKYISTYKISLKSGRNFTSLESEVEWNNNDKVIVNEKAIQTLGFDNAEDALSSRITWDERTLQIIGVIKDYHHEGLQNQIVPIIFYPAKASDLTVKLTTDHISDKVAALEKIYKKYFNANPFEYHFMDEFFNKQYEKENQFGQLFSSASLLAIFIACLGLLGLTLYTVESRTKEIGVRKVLGASVSSITRLLSLDFVKLVGFGILIAIPVSYYFMNSWLADFAYRSKMSWWVFALGACIAIGITILTISFHSIKAAMANPVKSIKTE